MTTVLEDSRLLLGRPVRDRILSGVSSYVNKVGRIGKLVSISIGEAPGIAAHVRTQAAAARAAGLPFDQQLWSADATQEACKALIQEMNEDAEVLGIVLQRPVPEHLDLRALLAAIHPLKDVEGMSPASIGNIVYNDMAMAPCTAAAAVELIRETGLKLKGLEVVMVGHSGIIGKPAATMLMAAGATVTVCHHMTRSVAMHSRRADAVIVAVGKPHLIGAEMIQPGAVVIDIGINQVTAADGTLGPVGDVDTGAVRQVAGWITPVPGGVGPVTVAILMRNAVNAHQRQKEAGWIG